MRTVSILPIANDSGGQSYRASAGDKHSEGKTAGQALDALTAKLGEQNFSALLVVQKFEPDALFNADQQARLSELMEMWRTARDQGQTLSRELQLELDDLVEAELTAATARTHALMQH